MKQVWDNFNELNLVFTCAGFTWDTMFHRMTHEQWNSIIDVHLNGTFLILHKAYPFMRELGKNELDEGKVPEPRKLITVSSMSSFGNLGQANYAAAKAGVEAFSKSLAKEVGSRGITVNSVAPGYIETDMTEQINNKMKEEILKQIPLSRFGKPEEVSELIEFLITDQASYITGQTIHINGGLYM